MEFHQANQGSLHVLLGTWNCSAGNVRESGLISRSGGALIVFLGLQREPGVYSRLMAEMAIQNSYLFSDVRTPVYLQWIPQESKLVWQDNTDASRSEAWDRGSLSSWRSDIEIPNNTQEVSGILNFCNTELRKPLRCQRNVRPLMEMRWRPRAFCRVSKVDSDILSSCDMNNEPALSLCREIRPSFELGNLGVHFTWSRKHRVPSHI